MDDPDYRDIDDQLTKEPLPASVTDVPWGLVSLGLWIVLLVVFTVQNADDVTVSFLWIDATMPIAILVLATAVSSALLTGLAQWVYRRKKKKRRKKREAEKGKA